MTTGAHSRDSSAGVRTITIAAAVLAAASAMPLIMYLIILINIGWYPVIRLVAEDVIIANLYLAFLGEIGGTLFILFILIPRAGVRVIRDVPLTDRPARDTLRWYLASVPLGILIGLIAAIIYTLLGFQLKSGYEGTLLLESHHIYNPMNIVIFFATGSLGAPLYEEALYRRLAIPMLERRGLSTRHAIFVSTAMFALAHLPLDVFNGSFAGAITHLLTVSTIGLVLGIVYVLTRRVMFPIVVHSLTNTTGFALYVISISEPVIGEGSLVLMASAGLLELVIIFLGLIVLYQLYREYTATTPPRWVTLLRSPVAHRDTYGMLLVIMIFISVITLQIASENVILLLIPDVVLIQISMILLVYAVTLVTMTWLAARER